MARSWSVSRGEQDEWALVSHRRAVAAQERGFFADLILPVDRLAGDEFPRRDTSLEKLARLKPAFAHGRGEGTITAGNSSPLTDGAAGIWVGTQAGIARLPAAVPCVRLVDFELAAIDVFSEGLLMAPVSAIPRLLARHGLGYGDIALWEIHEAFSAQLVCHIKGLQDRGFVKAKTGIDGDFGPLPVDRINPNGGSVALGHPFGATGARILSQAVKELAAMPGGSRAIVSICADGGEGSVALLER
jgi:acetyl-CoA C-acetyltransferase